MEYNRLGLKVILFVFCLIALVGIVGADTVTTIYAQNTSYQILVRSSHNITWADVRDGAGSDHSALNQTTITASVQSDTATDRFYWIYRPIISFPTDTLPDNAVISSATLGLYGSLTGVTLGYTGFAPVKYKGNIPAINNNEYSNFSFTPYAAYTNVSALSTTGYNNWTLNALAIENISKTGNTNYGLLLQWDIENTAPAWLSSKTTKFNFNAGSNSANRPFLEITYTVPDTDPPASITSLTNTTTTCNAVTYTWTNPTDADYDHLLVWKDGVASDNIANTTQTLTWSGIYANASHVLSTKTVDVVGNINATFVNLTVTTPKCTPFSKTSPLVAFSIDDGGNSTADVVYPILSSYGFNATSNVNIAAVIGSSPAYMRLANLTTLYNAGWDIANHGYSHSSMPTLTVAQQIALVTDGQNQLDAWGFTRASHHFVYPGGDHNAETNTSVITAGAYTARLISTGTLITPYTGSYYNLPVTVYIHNTTTVATVESAIFGGATNETVFLLTHYFTDTDTTYNWKPENLEELALWMSDNGYQAITISQWYNLNGGPTATKPVSMFTCTPSLISIPHLTTCNDTSTNTPTSWSWYFGDSTSNVTTQNTTHTYTHPGKFTIGLTATNAAGSSYNSSTVRVIQGGQMFTPKHNPLLVNLDAGTFTSSRDLSPAEREKVIRVLWIDR